MILRQELGGGELQVSGGPDTRGGIITFVGRPGPAPAAGHPVAVAVAVADCSPAASRAGIPAQEDDDVVYKLRNGAVTLLGDGCAIDVVP